jgi:hypothetical protein
MDKAGNEPKERNFNGKNTANKPLPEKQPPILKTSYV